MGNVLLATILSYVVGTGRAAAAAMAGFSKARRDPDDLDFRRVLEIANPYLGKVYGVYTDWTPLKGRHHPFPEDVDASDPWQFKNFRVT